MRERFTRFAENLLDQLVEMKVTSPAELKELALAGLLTGMVLRSADTWNEIDQAGGFSAWIDERMSR